MGLEKSDGPVLGALLHGNYTDVHILAYTNKKKKSPNNHDIDSYSNTTEAHELFETWLTEQLDSQEKDVKVKIHPVKLVQLNDTKGIYKAVNDILNDVSSKEINKEVTLYLSPGTPVMSFSWAFAAMANPGMKIKVIASSEPSKQPEEIHLPYELLDSSGIRHEPVKTPNPNFDVVFHLFGEQKMPSVLGIMQFKSKLHIFVNSKKYPATIMKQLIGPERYKELTVNPFDPKNVELEILKTISGLPDVKKIGFNLTGGTKLMFAGALAASNKVNGIPFYFETKNHNLIYLSDFTFAQSKRIKNVETFFRANTNNFILSNKGLWEDIANRNDPKRIILTNKLWDNRNKIKKLYKELSALINHPGKSFNIKKGNINAILRTNGEVVILIDDERMEFSNWLDFAKYLCGGWFEEYTYLIIRPLFERGLIKDLRIGMEISIKDQIVKKDKDWKDQLRNIHGQLYQELDIVFSDGKSLYIVECKARRLKSGDIMKLQNIVSHFGGAEGRGILISTYKTESVIINRRVEEARNINLISGQDLPKKLTGLFC